MHLLLILIISLLLATSAFAQVTADTQKCADSGGNVDEIMAACERAITSGQLSSAILAIMFSKRGNAWAEKGDNDRAIADYNEAVRLNPKYAVAYNNRGSAWDSKGDYDRAIADYNEAIRLNPKYAMAYHNRGTSQFYLGRFETSAADFAQSLRLNREQPYVVIWRYLALARAPSGQLAISELAASAVPLDKQKWPAPIIDLLGGRIDPTALRRAAEHADPKIQAEQSCEVNFYLGQWHILNSRPKEARGLLQEAEQKCPKTFSEYAGAMAELKRLGGI